ncbi:unnamed protein product, partial [Scytosiphon promiscuus]
ESLHGDEAVVCVMAPGGKSRKGGGRSGKSGGGSGSGSVRNIAFAANSDHSDAAPVGRNGYPSGVWSDGVFESSGYSTAGGKGLPATAAVRSRSGGVDAESGGGGAFSQADPSQESARDAAERAARE